LTKRDFPRGRYLGRKAIVCLAIGLATTILVCAYYTGHHVYPHPLISVDRDSLYDVSVMNDSRIVAWDRYGIKVWSRGHGKLTYWLIPQCTPHRFSIASSENWVAAMDDHGCISTWDTSALHCRPVAPQRPTRWLRGKESISLKWNNQAIAFSPAGNRLATFGETLAIWDPASLRKQLALTNAGTGPGRVVFSPTSDLIYCVREGEATILVIDTRNGEIKEHILISNHGDVIALDSSPDGRMIATCSISGLVTVWSCRTSRCLKAWKIGNAPRPPFSLAFSPDHDMLACISNHIHFPHVLFSRVSIWSTKRWALRKTYTRLGTYHRYVTQLQDECSSLVFSDDPNELVIAGWEEKTLNNRAGVIRVISP